MNRTTILGCSIAVAMLAASAASAATTTVTVDSQQGPWDQSVNPTLAYGPDDNMAPASVSSGFDFSVGSTFTITYLSGTTSYAFGTTPTDANGVTSRPVDGTKNMTGYYPSEYIPSAQYPANLAELVGAFANASGVVIGSPFLIGDGPTSETVADSGVTQLLLGINDDHFTDNSGALVVGVSGPAAVSAAPEPATWATLMLGVGAIGAAFRQAKRKHGFTLAKAI